tara:strand:- start:587 stop:763 length:177 start_codon:yes stop_codon:yes gene_type:complete
VRIRKETTTKWNIGKNRKKMNCTKQKIKYITAVAQIISNDEFNDLEESLRLTQKNLKL